MSHPMFVLSHRKRGQQEDCMNNIDFTHHHNQVNVAPECPYCMGAHAHEPWCASRVPSVRYAFDILFEPRKLTLGDALILHSLGVTWSERATT